MQLRFTVRVNNEIVAKAAYIGVAAKICEGYGVDKQVKIIDNAYGRVAFNNQYKHWSFGHIYNTVRDKCEQFARDYDAKMEAAEARAAEAVSKPIKLSYNREVC